MTQDDYTKLSRSTRLFLSTAEGSIRAAINWSNSIKVIRNLILEPPLLTKKGWFDTSPFFEVARSSAPSYFERLSRDVAEFQSASTPWIEDWNKCCRGRGLYGCHHTTLERLDEIASDLSLKLRMPYEVHEMLTEDWIDCLSKKLTNADLKSIDSAYYFESGGLEKYLDEFPRLARHFKRECIYMAVQEGFSSANIA